MTLGLDIDGTITRHPTFFAWLARTLRDGGHRVIVITFRESRDSAIADLAAWGLPFDELITWSFADNAGEDMLAWKGRICAERGVEILFDDDPGVLCRLGPKVLSLMVVDHETYDLSALCDD
jgi:hypothetical protein